LSACLPVKWLPATLPAQLEAALREVLDQWSCDWGAPSAKAVSAHLLGASQAPAALCAPWGELPGEWHGALTRALLGPAALHSPVAQGALLEATADLQNALHQRLQPASAHPFTPATVGHGGVDVHFELLGLNFGFALSVADLQSAGWLATAPARRLRAIAIERALQDLPVPLTAHVGRASVSAADVLQMRPGDILLLDEPLDAPLQITSAGSPLRLTAHLGASATSAMRAMRWLASS